MVEHGCVVAACDTLGPELRRALLERGMPELFAFPVETKQKLAGLDFESFNVAAVTDPSSVRDFSSIFWLQGNPEFSDTVISFVSNLLKLEHTVEKMTLDGLGVREENIAGHRQTLTHSLRLSHYGVPEESKMDVTLPRHTNPSFTKAIAKDGSWITIPPEADTITIIAGDPLTVVTNGRVPACVHRVKAASNRERFSVLFTSVAKNGAVLSPMDELVDRDHPLMYNPLKTDEYVVFRYSEEGFKVSNPFEEFCGVHKSGSSME
ncbi:hypothetical protein GQ55_9G436500 [Panicum hallii var. hallii]|uniref:Isopenicillin N synthase-like Fe(2+) 2OG dioxygenase domain-containing protein n=1 Tax=Panicum hallii var. hallii TaxID=1504633 RepID=A0A2T7CB78_9POAL|nr:hypothetical protein GQ55_9G436500 [Panicum hallii var. hallii]